MAIARGDGPADLLGERGAGELADGPNECDGHATVVQHFVFG